MGKPTGFIEIQRKKHPTRPIQERLKDWREVYLPYPSEVLAEQGAAEFYRRVGYWEVGCLQAHAFQNGQYRDVLVMERLLEP